MSFMDILAQILNPNPGTNRLVGGTSPSSANYLAQTGAAPQLSSMGEVVEAPQPVPHGNAVVHPGLSGDRTMLEINLEDDTMAKVGGPDPGAGRPKGSFKPPACGAAEAAAEGMARSVVLQVLRDENAPEERRNWAAEKSARYIHARPRPISQLHRDRLARHKHGRGRIEGALWVITAAAAIGQDPRRRHRA